MPTFTSNRWLTKTIIGSRKFAENSPFSKHFSFCSPNLFFKFFVLNFYFLSMGPPILSKIMRIFRFRNILRIIVEAESRVGSEPGTLKRHNFNFANMSKLAKIDKISGGVFKLKKNPSWYVGRATRLSQ